MDVHGRKVQQIRVSPRKLQGHWVYPACLRGVRRPAAANEAPEQSDRLPRAAAFELEHRKTVVAVGRELVPNVTGDAKAVVKSVEVFEPGDEGRLKAADLV